MGLTVPRAARVAERVQEELARLIREELRDPRIGFVTVTSVKLSPDLRHARVYVSVLGADAAESLRALEHAGPFLRRSLAREAGLRFTPSLSFLPDRSAETAQRVESLLDDWSHEREPGDEEPG